MMNRILNPLTKLAWCKFRKLNAYMFADDANHAEVTFKREPEYNGQPLPIEVKFLPYGSPTTVFVRDEGSDHDMLRIAVSAANRVKDESLIDRMHRLREAPAGSAESAVAEYLQSVLRETVITRATTTEREVAIVQAIVRVESIIEEFKAVVPAQALANAYKGADEVTAAATGCTKLPVSV